MLLKHEGQSVVHWWLPIACEGGKAACLNVDPAVSVGLILVRWTGLHLGETLISCDGVNFHPALPGLLLSGRRLQWGKRERQRAAKIKQNGVDRMCGSKEEKKKTRKIMDLKSYLGRLIRTGNILNMHRIKRKKTELSRKMTRWKTSSDFCCFSAWLM